MPCLVQGHVEDLTEVNRVGCPELIGTAQFRDRDTVFQGDACESIIRRDLEKGKYVVVRKSLFYLRVGKGGGRKRGMIRRYLVSKDSSMEFCSVGQCWEICRRW
jgi:hypothetical protein